MTPETLTPDCTELRIEWPDGRSDAIPAAILRGAARDASSLREQIDTGTIRVADGIEITGCDPVGTYGVNIRFSDGHDRAIYPFVYLREIADEALATN
jgi:DUF971 family protein